MSNETWLPIPGFEGFYEASSEGRVRSLDRRIKNAVFGRPGTRLLRGRVLTPKRRKQVGGYLEVTLCKPGVREGWLVHRIVLLAFVGPCPPGMLTRHLNGDPGDNRPSNLTYGTPSENMRDKVTHGTHHEVNKTHCRGGHPYDESGDVYFDTRRGKRVCRICRRENARARRLLSVNA